MVHNTSAKTKIKTSTDFGITSVLAKDLCCCCSTFQHYRSHKGRSSIQRAADQPHGILSFSPPRAYKRLIGEVQSTTDTVLLPEVCTKCPIFQT
jgi:hypothetical protein